MGGMWNHTLIEDLSTRLGTPLAVLPDAEVRAVALDPKGDYMLFTWPALSGGYCGFGVFNNGCKLYLSMSEQEVKGLSDPTATLWQRLDVLNQERCRKGFRAVPGFDRFLSDPVQPKPETSIISDSLFDGILDDLSDLF